MSWISTIGYEGAAIDDFVETLLRAGVTALVDIREVAVSRRKGFSKRSLSQAVEMAGISYFHLRGLGDPKPGRDAARRGDFLEFQRIFRLHLESDVARQDLSAASSLARQHLICLMCYERDPQACHRKIVAEQLSANLCAKIRHLGVQQGVAGASFGDKEIAYARSC